MDAQIRDRLERLANYIQQTKAPLSISQTLMYRGRTKPGYNILGLICEAYRRFTGNGQWIISNPNAPEIPDFRVSGDMEDYRLPQVVADYFGFRDQVGSFYVGDLPQSVKTMMRRTRKTSTFTLQEIGLDYERNGKEIASRVIRAMPSSLLKPEVSDPKN